MKINKSILIFIVILLSQLNIYSQKFDSSDLYFEEAKKDIAEQNFTKAAKMSWRGLQISKNDLDLKVLLGKANLQLGKYDTARYVLKQVYDKRRKDIDVLQYLVTIEQTTKRYSDAICFVNELLEITPYSRGWHLRKIEIYKEMGNFEEAERALKRIYQIYPNDTEIESRYNYIMIGDGNDALKNKNYDDANVIYKTIIDNNPSNKDAYLGLIRNEILKGNPEVALQYTNRSLIELPSDRQLIEKKVGLLEQLGRHEEAIVFIQTDPNVSKDKFPELHSKTLPYLMQQSASFNEYNDTYEINKKLAEMNGNSESTAYVIKNALGKGYDVDAEYFLKKNIKRSPNNKKLLVQLKELYRPIKDKERFEKEVIELHEKFPNDTDITSDYNLVIYNRAKDLVINKQYGEALEIFNELVNFPDFTEESESQIFGIYLLQERYDEATDQIDKLIGLDPDNPDYLEKKSTLYQQMELFDDALEITRSLEQNYPLSQRYPTLYVSQIEAYATYLMREQRYRAVLPLVEDGLTRENNNKRLLDIAINASSAIPDYQKGINYGKSALTFYPNNKNFKLKLANLYSQNKQYDEAKGVLDSLRTVYVYDRNVKNALAEVLFYRARNQEEEGLVEEALVNYDSAVALNPADRGSLMRMVNLHITQKPNDESLDFINDRLEKTPEDNFLLYKKGVVFELLQQYDSAYYYQKFREIDNPYEKQQWGLTLEVLKAAQLKNQLAATYLQATSDSIAFSTSIASLNYSREYTKMTYGADINYAARTSGVGVQGGVNVSRIFTKTIYADVGLLVGTRFFPKIKIYGNAYKGFKSGYEAQVGLSFARLQNDQNYLTFNLGGSKTWEDIWVNARVSFSPTSVPFVDNTTNPVTTTFESFFYTNLMVQARINVNARKDYFSVIVSGGSAPFDQQLEFQENTFLNFTNVMIGAGYMYHLTPKSSLLVNGTWINFLSNQTTINQVIQDQIYTNQYNLSVSFITRF
ncbi:tetratricopeptide repeat protein [Polaribacter vadi]|uniref:tetratricopeptide repeat protein n=1 Tax=Polaribacter vadi TaxID=1774273 RepID=UPI0030ECF1BF|tara:strand:+ start:9762 stop:12704 length:2943 start_codon:yes stop_codon:yes gene_type:complete